MFRVVLWLSVHRVQCVFGVLKYRTLCIFFVFYITWAECCVVLTRLLRTVLGAVHVSSVVWRSLDSCAPCYSAVHVGSVVW